MRLGAVWRGIRAEEDEALAGAEVRAFARNAPVLFVSLCVNAVAIAYTHHGVAPDWLTLAPASLLVSISIARLVAWRRIARKPPEGRSAVARIRRTSVMAATMAVSSGIWGIALSTHGDLALRMHVLFFVAISLIVSVHCMSQLRTAPSIMGLIAVPQILWFTLTGDAVMAAATLSFAVSFGAMVLMQTVAYRDFHFLNAVIDENHKLAHTDALTRLPNRRSYFGRLQETLDEAAASGGRFTVGLIDLDGFKPVNDTFGHHAGDEVLREVASRLENIMDGIGSAARLGGDEFGLIIKGERDLERLGRAICASLQMPYALRDSTAQIGASVGFATFPAAARSGDMLVERADYALYFAKASHRGTAICFAPEHEAHLRSQAIIEQALRSADLESEFHLVFQPIVDMVEARVDAYEALARWTCPTLGLVSPADFIVVAERSGLILDLTRVLLGKALSAMAAWPEDVRLSFNLSAHDIASAEGLFRITDLVIDSGIDPSRIIFEVTETGLMRDLVDAQKALNELKALGVRIALDDFGTGYSSLSYVHRLPIDKLKIDRSFVTHICDDKASLNVIRALIDLSRNLDCACIVEGVETVEQMLMLRSAGCRLMQGYLFAKPMPQAEIDAFHRRPLAIMSSPSPSPAPDRALEALRLPSRVASAA